MSVLRSTLFWLHLAAGVIGGLVIAMLCFTGTALAFEKELVAWAERDARRIEAPGAGAARLGVDELAARVRQAFPDAKPGNIVLARDPHTAVAFPVSRTEGYHANPYTGEVRQPASYAMGRFMQTMLAWHRYLGFSGEKSRPHGKLVTGIANLAFCFLALSGLVLWWPRSLSWRAFRPAVWFTQNASARGRDWNWHNVLGFWSAPVLITLTLTAMPISFRWAADLTYTLTGTPLPASGPQSSGAPPPAATVPAPAAAAQTVSRDALLATVQRELPAWQTVTFRFAHQPDPAKPQAVTFTVREAGTWPRTATTTLQFDPFTGTLLQRDGYADLSPARQLRAWTRFLHTGEALGPWAQFIAAVASFAGVILVWTGLALAFRRLLGRKAGAAARNAN
ncbi:hypothetical protein Verru16b_01732 [Lacunisphaera limnophila]|uniref:PepSY-associated TM helix n=1 Tax=Lacunisphaera limnophila TaxID=1838286 RepID=A0A1D8AUW7_9BACT|nr:PepSY-associated TM helix domain-containing protein [Lacunisphaera limnophila]AOS44665.1 hypothetical protein Verru16b_01732 [Lacunisphaera limnophila]